MSSGGQTVALSGNAEIGLHQDSRGTARLHDPVAGQHVENSGSPPETEGTDRKLFAAPVYNERNLPTRIGFRFDMCRVAPTAVAAPDG